MNHALKHASRQFRFCRKGDLFWHARFSAPRWIINSALREIQFPVEQDVPTPARVGQEHLYLAVFDPSARGLKLPMHEDPLYTKGECVWTTYRSNT